MQKEQAMSDNLRRYRAIRDALIQGYPGQPRGTDSRRNNQVVCQKSFPKYVNSPPSQGNCVRESPSTFTRLITLKSLCEDATAAARFALHLAHLTYRKMQEKACPSQR